jgi:predicted regulator of Ras-like GTPase activity (Roadblock/LC7/MglB family)
MDASAALDRLQEISSQVRAAVVFDRAGTVLGSTLSDEQRAADIAREARELLDEAEGRGAGHGDFAQLEVALQSGSVFVVRHDERLIAATTPPDPTVGLVFYDLKSCLRDVEQSPKPPSRKSAPPRAAATPKPRAKPKPKPRSPRPKQDDAKP